MQKCEFLVAFSRRGFPNREPAHIASIPFVDSLTGVVDRQILQFKNMITFVFETNTVFVFRSQYEEETLVSKEFASTPLIG